jgi:uncharacterized protein YfaS (alpha-2-macroglobulin family)
VEALRVTGLLQNGGTPIEGVLVELLDSNGDVIAQTLSDANGDYSFSGVDIDELRPMNDYTVRIPVNQTALDTIHAAPGGDFTRVDDQLVFDLTTGSFVIHFLSCLSA